MSSQEQIYKQRYLEDNLNGYHSNFPFIGRRSSWIDRYGDSTELWLSKGRALSANYRKEEASFTQSFLQSEPVLQGKVLELLAYFSGDIIHRDGRRIIPNSETEGMVGDLFGNLLVNYFGNNEERNVDISAKRDIFCDVIPLHIGSRSVLIAMQKLLTVNKNISSYSYIRHIILSLSDEEQAELGLKIFSNSQRSELDKRICQLFSVEQALKIHEERTVVFAAA